MFLMEEILNQLVVDVYENLTIYGVLYMAAGFKPDFFQQFQILSEGGEHSSFRISFARCLRYGLESHRLDHSRVGGNGLFRCGD